MQKLLLQSALVGFFLLGGCGGTNSQTSPQTPNASSTPKAAPVQSSSLEQGKAALERGDIDQAKQLFEKELSAHPKSAKAHHYLAVCLEQLGKPAEAETHYRTALQLDPTLQDSTVNLSALLIGEKKYDEATNLLNAAIEKTPKDPLLITNLAFALMFQGNLSAAEEQFHRALELQNNPQTALGLAECLGRQGKTQPMVELLRKVTQSQTASLQDLVQGAEMLRKAKEFDDCIRAYDVALQKKRLAELFVRRGVCKRLGGDASGAKSDFTKATETNPKFAQGFFWLGRQLWEADHDKKAAIEAFEQCAQLAPKSQCKANADKLRAQK